MIYRFIHLAETEFPVLPLCRALGVSRSAYYTWREGKTYGHNEQKQEIARQVKTIFYAHYKRYGTRRIEAELKAAGLGAGRYQIRQRMLEQGLIAIQPRSFVPKTTQTNPNLQRSPNLLLNLPPLTALHQVWVGDITYLPMLDGSWLYLATWMDLYSRMIVGWHLHTSLEAQLVIRSFEKAWQRRKPPANLIIHSDGGGQYMDRFFRHLLRQHRCRQSMTRLDNHYDNAFAESLFSRFKAELLCGGTFRHFDHAHAAIFEYIEAYYNPRRRHSALNYQSPENFEKLLISNTP